MQAGRQAGKEQICWTQEHKEINPPQKQARLHGAHMTVAGATSCNVTCSANTRTATCMQVAGCQVP
jgi:hypothetical protein